MLQWEINSILYVLQHVKVSYFKKRLYIIINRARKTHNYLRNSNKNINFAHFFARV